ncbi:MAG: hypothetical protein J6S38_05745 [Erysipelotrichaceae bacterium]|nr:hypothetical protein [Erysipelotrichaceae bacterium]
MKKLILLIFSLFLVLFPRPVSANVDVTVEVDNNVEGETNRDLNNQFVDLILSNDYYSYDVFIDDDISDWFTNIPEGLTASVSDVDDNYLTVEFTGQSAVEVDEVIQVVIPSGKVLDDFGNPIEGTLSNDPDTEDSRYLIVDLTIRAYYDRPSTVSGYVGEELDVQYVYIKLENDTYTTDIINAVLSTYNGLTATVIDTDDDNIATVRYTGTPLEEDHSLIHSVLDKDHLNISTESLIVPDRADVLFDIRKRSVEPDVSDQPAEQPTYTIPFTGVE